MSQLPYCHRISTRVFMAWQRQHRPSTMWRLSAYQLIHWTRSISLTYHRGHFPRAARGYHLQQVRPTLQLAPNSLGRERQVQNNILGDVKKTLGVECRTFRVKEWPTIFSAHDGSCPIWITVRKMLHRWYRGVEQFILRALTTSRDRLQSAEECGAEGPS